MDIDLSRIEVIHNVSQERFEVLLGEQKAVLVYMIKAGLFLLLHTEVPPDYEGHGIAGKMAFEAMEYAKKQGLKIRSYCSYTTRYIERHKEYQDLLG